MPKKRSAPNFEQALTELESLVDDMEKGDLSLEDALQGFERGLELARFCQKSLDEAEQKVEILSQAGDKLVPEPFETDHD